MTLNLLSECGTVPMDDKREAIPSAGDYSGGWIAWGVADRFTRRQDDSTSRARLVREAPSGRTRTTGVCISIAEIGRVLPPRVSFR